MPACLLARDARLRIELIGGQAGGRWEPVLLFPMRYSIVVMWALAPCFGLMGALFYWLMRGTQANGSRSPPAA